MVVKTSKPQDKTTEYSFTRKAGRSIIDRRPVFSPDEQSLVIIVENIARVYSVQTGELVRTLETETQVNELVGVCFDKDGYNVYGCSRDGLLVTWTWEKGAVLREFRLTDRQVCTFDLIDHERCFITSVGPTYGEIHLTSYSLKLGTLETEYTGHNIPYYGICRVAIGWCHGDRFAAIINSTKVIYMQNLDKPHKYSYLSNYNQFRVMDIAAHQTDPTLAIVDTLGRATIIKGNLFNYQEVAKEILHWHFLPPFAVEFSPSGGYLITGGMEKVLVKWTIGNLSNKANSRVFIPRLPGIVRYIAVSNSNIAVTLSNNSVVIANAQMRVHCTILECGGLSAAARAAGGCLVYHKLTGSLLMAGRPGHLQMYSANSDKVLFNLDITEMNTIPSESKFNLVPLETEITCAAMSANGFWLVTSEYRHDGVLYPEERLKFWATNTVKSAVPIELVTCVNLSHGGSKVVAITLNHPGNLCVTAGTDQKFRIWKRDHIAKTKSEWSCLTACYYSSGAQFQTSSVYNDVKKIEVTDLFQKVDFPYMKTVSKRNDIMLKIMNMHKDSSFIKNVEAENVDSETELGGVAISQDGSLIAAWFGCKLTLWDTHLCNLRATLSHEALRPKGKDVQFGSGDAARYLVCTTDSCLAVFNLLSLSIKWLVNLRPTCLVADLFSNKMAVVTDQNDVFVFTPHESTPIVRKNRLLDPRTGVFNVCTFAPAEKNATRLYLIRNDSELYCLQPERTTKDRLEVLSRSNVPTSNFGALLAEQQLSEVTPAATGELTELNSRALGDGAIKQFLSAAPHMVPSVSLICTSFLEHISGQETTEIDDEVEPSTMDVDPQSSDEETEVIKAPDTPRPQLWTADYEAVKEKRLKRILKVPILREEAAAAVFGLNK